MKMKFGVRRRNLIYVDKVNKVKDTVLNIRAVTITQIIGY
jgi:hypothetical protein